MIASAELRALVDEWRAPAKKARMFAKKRKDDGERRDAARRLAALSSETSDEELVEALAHATAAFPDDRAVRLAYARALAGAGRVGEAIAEYEERLQTRPDDAQDLLDVGTLYEETGRADLAHDRLRRCVDAFVAAGDVDRAVAASRKLIVLDPQSLENAADLVALLRARDPGALADGLEHLANVYRERGKLGQESEVCAELLALRPERVDVRDRLAALYANILDADPDDDEAWSGLERMDAAQAARLRVTLDRAVAPAPAAATRPEPVVVPAEIHAPPPPAPARRAASPPAPLVRPHVRGLGATYAGRKAQELIAAGDLMGASLCLERMVRTHPDAGTHLRLAECYGGLHRDEDAGRQGLRALAIAHVANDGGTCDEALGFLASLRETAAGPLADALILNHRPESADTLYEEFAEIWDSAAH